MQLRTCKNHLTLSDYLVHGFFLSVRLSIGVYMSTLNLDNLVVWQYPTRVSHSLVTVNYLTLFLKISNKRPGAVIAEIRYTADSLPGQQNVTLTAPEDFLL